MQINMRALFHICIFLIPATLRNEIIMVVKFSFAPFMHYCWWIDSLVNILKAAMNQTNNTSILLFK